MWYLLMIAALIVGLPVVFDVWDFMPWGFVAAGLVWAAVATHENRREPLK